MLKIDNYVRGGKLNANIWSKIGEWEYINYIV